MKKFLYDWYFKKKQPFSDKVSFIEAFDRSMRSVIVEQKFFKYPVSTRDLVGFDPIAKRINNYVSGKFLYKLFKINRSQLAINAIKKIEEFQDTKAYKLNIFLIQLFEYLFMNDKDTILHDKNNKNIHITNERNLESKDGSFYTYQLNMDLEGFCIERIKFTDNQQSENIVIKIPFVMPQQSTFIDLGDEIYSKYMAENDDRELGDLLDSYDLFAVKQILLVLDKLVYDIGVSPIVQGYLELCNDFS